VDSTIELFFKKKSKFVLLEYRNTFSINNLGARKSGQLHAPRGLPPRLYALAPNEQEIGGPKPV